MNEELELFIGMFIANIFIYLPYAIDCKYKFWYVIPITIGEFILIYFSQKYLRE